MLGKDSESREQSKKYSKSRKKMGACLQFSKANTIAPPIFMRNVKLINN